MSINESVEDPSPRSKSSSNPRKKQQTPAAHGTNSRSSLSQQGDSVQKDTMVPPRPDDSLTSSSRSIQSPASFDFSKLDRLEGVINAPGTVRSEESNPSQQDSSTLPDEKGFSIQIGSELFKLSGASLMSDGRSIAALLEPIKETENPRAPSYFSAFFIEQLQQGDDHSGSVKTLLIDRDPETFRDIARHLQVPRLQAQLFESEIFVEVGNENFRVPRDIFSAPGDTPNYFTLGFTVFFTSPGDIFPGLNPSNLLRPPAIHPPRIPNRSPQIFSDILHMLRGYVLTIRNEDHRDQLLKDARYYNLRGLEQKLIPYEITYNLENRVSEMVIRLQDVKPSQISAVYDNYSSPSQSTPTQRRPGYVHYARPFISEPHHALILEISSSTVTEPILLDIMSLRITLFGNTRSRITALFQTIANKLNLPTTVPLGLIMTERAAEARGKGPESTGLSEKKIKADVTTDAHIILDGVEWVDGKRAALSEESEAPGFEGEPGMEESFMDSPRDSLLQYATSSTKRALDSPSEVHPGKRRRREGGGEYQPLWTVHKSQWRLRLQPRSGVGYGDEDTGEAGMEIVMVAVKIEATSGEKARNFQRRFLS
ncbi:MAG: hypothetical protein Q9224_005649 [Gallowayella concinna]